ncbi:hypothetical protein, partial [Paenibacillus xylanexedens]|uniref:hypothetical protein n=1 Tax=Paenibacillus xylanexedens TaxID=528191 RepID=UPI001C92F0F1
YRYVNGEKCEWSELSENSRADIQELRINGWKTLLECVWNYEYGGRLIWGEVIGDLLGVGMVEGYEDYYDDDGEGVWIGEF